MTFNGYTSEELRLIDPINPDFYSAILTTVVRDVCGYDPQLLLTDQRTEFEKDLDSHALMVEPSYSGSSHCTRENPPRESYEHLPF